MTQTLFKIRGIDPLMIRDGRPFTAATGGVTARSLPLPLPPTVAGFVRTQYGNGQGWEWTTDDSKRAEMIAVQSPVLMRGQEVLFPAPADALLLNGLQSPIRLRPSDDYVDSCDLPEGLRPVMPANDVEASGKPRQGCQYWPAKHMLSWLEGHTVQRLPDIGGLPEEERVGIAIGADGRAQEGMLYTALLRSFGEKSCEGGLSTVHEYSLLARAELPESGAAKGPEIKRTGTLGGERRLTVIEPVKEGNETWPECTTSLAAALTGARRVRMVLATPAHFQHGWRPDWLDSGLTGVPPSLRSESPLRLVGVASGRRVAFSGWGLNSKHRYGPGPIRWLVPAGATYFFEVDGEIPEAHWRAAWLQPVSDNEQDRRNGLGLALWGRW